MEKTVELETMKSRIEKLEKEQQLEILKILNTNPDVKINENKSGVYINLSYLEPTIVSKLKAYLDYVKDQEKVLHLAETKKQDYVKTFFEERGEVAASTM
jgi:hypothetical protein|tara:strand:- start:905 stop:1204 length:300 start_codon:yes stop_codon:yes gene_type:complete